MCWTILYHIGLSYVICKLSFIVLDFCVFQILPLYLNYCVGLFYSLNLLL
jgi:hypothetical protein